MPHYEITLTWFPTPFENSTVRAGGLTLHVERHGEVGFALVVARLHCVTAAISPLYVCDVQHPTLKPDTR